MYKLAPISIYRPDTTGNLVLVAYIAEPKSREWISKQQFSAAKQRAELSKPEEVDDLEDDYPDTDDEVEGNNGQVGEGGA